MLVLDKFFAEEEKTPSMAGPEEAQKRSVTRLAS